MKDVLDTDRVEEPPKRRPEPAGPVPQGGAEGRHRVLAPRGRSPRHLRLLGRQRRLGRGHHRPGRGRPPLHRPPDLREGPVLRGRPGRRPDRPRLRLHDLRRGRPQHAEDAYHQAGITNPGPSWPWPRCTTASRPTELVLMEDLGFAERGMAWKEVLAGTFDLDGELPVNPDGGLKCFGHPIGASGLRMLFECWLQLRGEAGDRPDRRSSARQAQALTHNLGGAPGACVSFVSVVGSAARLTGTDRRETGSGGPLPPRRGCGSPSSSCPWTTTSSPGPCRRVRAGRSTTSCPTSAGVADDALNGRMDGVATRPRGPPGTGRRGRGISTAMPSSGGPSRRRRSSRSRCHRRPSIDLTSTSRTSGVRSTSRAPDRGDPASRSSSWRNERSRRCLASTWKPMAPRSARRPRPARCGATATTSTGR